MKKKEQKATIRNKKADKKMKILLRKLENFERVATTWDKGLSSQEVLVRENEGLINRTKKNVTKSYGKMVYDNFSMFLQY